MKTYLALLRGINVSGQKIIKMELLRKVLQELDFQNIRTYIQSGNIIFESKILDVKILERQITDCIEKHFGFIVPIIIITPEELAVVIDKNPYAKQNETDMTQPYVSFLSEIPKPENLAAFKAIDFGSDQFNLIDKTLYIWYETSAGTSKLNNSTIEKRLKLQSTARNWKTVLKLYALAKAE